jgi:hypothetical protein
MPNDTMLITFLYEMYINNNRTINNLTEQNNQIRNSILEIYQNGRNSRNNTFRRNINIPLNFTNPTNINNLSDRFTYFRNFSDPVVIAPTQEQINNSTRSFMYSQILNPVNTSCPISLEPFTDSTLVTMIRHCHHIFNTDSLMNWFRTNCRCPVCRFDIRDYNESPIHEPPMQTHEPPMQTHEPPEPIQQPQIHRNRSILNDNIYNTQNTRVLFDYYEIPIDPNSILSSLFNLVQDSSGNILNNR